jgi:hypothetical protein
MDNDSPDPRQAAIAAGRALQAILDSHIALLVSGADQDDAAVEVDRELWEAVGAYGDALDELYDEEDDDSEESDELTFTVRTRYDYTVVDEKAFLAAGTGVGAAVYDLVHAAGRALGAIEIPALETGSGLLTVHINGEPLVPEDFSTAEEATDLLLIAPNETEAYIMVEPVYGSRAEAEAAAKNAATEN